MPLEMSADEFVIMKVRETGRCPVTFIDEPEAERLFCPMISVDDHALEPPSLFEGRLPTKFQDRAPHLGPGEDGAPWWVVEGAQIPIIMANGASGRPLAEWGYSACSYEDFRGGCYDSVARLSDMDLTGVWASLCFGSAVWGFAGTRFSKMSDPELGLACLQAYNDWMIDEWCAADRQRYIPCQLTWLRDARTPLPPRFIATLKGISGGQLFGES